MVKKMKAQISMEALVLFAILTILFLIWLQVYSDTYMDINAKKEVTVADNFGRMIQTELFAAAESHTGYHSEFYAPENVNGVKINAVTVIPETNRTLIVNTTKHTFYYHIPLTNGSIIFGTNTIDNEKGVICCNC